MFLKFYFQFTPHRICNEWPSLRLFIPDRYLPIYWFHISVNDTRFYNNTDKTLLLHWQNSFKVLKLWLRIFSIFRRPTIGRHHDSRLLWPRLGVADGEGQRGEGWPVANVETSQTVLHKREQVRPDWGHEEDWSSSKDLPLLCLLFIRSRLNLADSYLSFDFTGHIY